jgi:hypothetical protein
VVVDFGMSALFTARLTRYPENAYLSVGYYSGVDFAMG